MRDWVRMALVPVVLTAILFGACSGEGPSPLERDVLTPLASLKSAGQVEVTDFTNLVATWRTKFAAKACVYRQ